ncbi:FMN-dependent NADH-azoreductase [Niastella caeni]|uniref:FMN dependent NADH:quinone oxidoreductase n=1 Tax=Niastella caeni TaxID=2569763 RepID=A0A4S8HCI9_9BACT|nr:NAD(P)H-dependent oxidoreductase [Niastella caeni]THU32011.1 FMN-dependent NADH-azoreductase [Niastella caeni]
MKTLLRIDASIRKAHSYSRELADYFQNQWQIRYPDSQIIYRDLAAEPVPHLNQQLTEAFFMNPAPPDVLALSDTLLNELQAADALLISSPLYNLSLPSTLKSYIDHIVRIHKTFTYAEGGAFRGLLNGKEAFIIHAKGGLYRSLQLEQLDFQEGYLRTILNFIGIEKVTVFPLEGTRNEAYAIKAMEEIRHAIMACFQTNL